MFLIKFRNSFKLGKIINKMNVASDGKIRSLKENSPITIHGHSPSYPPRRSPVLGEVLQTPQSKLNSVSVGTPQRVIPRPPIDQPYPYPQFPNLTRETKKPSPIKVSSPVKSTSHIPSLQESKERADYRVKFSVLRNNYPTMTIPDPNDDIPLDHIKTMFEEYTKKIRIEKSVEANQNYLLILWLVIEFVSVYYFKLDFMLGYTSTQLNQLSKYQRLLIEMGTKNTESGIGEGWPIEIRLLVMSIFNGIIFLIINVLIKRVGNNPNNSKYADELSSKVGEMLSGNGKDHNSILKTAQEATTDNPAPASAQPQPGQPLDGWGSMLSSFMPMFTNLMGNQQQQTASKPAPVRKVGRFFQKQTKSD